MSFISQVDINGTTFNVNTHLTIDPVAIRFQDGIKAFTDIIEKSQGDALAMSAADVTAVENAIVDLVDLAENGISDPGITNDPQGRTFYMSQRMLESLKALFDTMDSAGIQITLNPGQPPTVNFGILELQLWYNLGKSSPVIEEILNFAKFVTTATLDGYIPQKDDLGVELALDDPDRVKASSLQAFTELIYVKTGNEVFADKVDELEEALEITKQTLDLLGDLVFLNNRIETLPADGTNVLSQLAPTFSGLTGSAVVTSYIGAYRSAAVQRYISTDIVPIPDAALRSGLPGGRSQSLEDALTEFQRIRSGLISLASLLAQSFITPDLGDESTLYTKVTTVLANMDAAIAAGATSVNGTGRVNSLLAGLQTTDPSAKALFIWLIDDKGDTDPVFDQDGTVARNLNVAITAGQNLNDTQKENVRRFLLVFEEYYKSASAILNKLTQILEKIAQGIAR